MAARGDDTESEDEDARESRHAAEAKKERAAAARAEKAQKKADRKGKGKEGEANPPPPPKPAPKPKPKAKKDEARTVEQILAEKRAKHVADIARRYPIDDEEQLRDRARPTRDEMDNFRARRTTLCPSCHVYSVQKGCEDGNGHWNPRILPESVGKTRCEVSPSHFGLLSPGQKCKTCGWKYKTQHSILKEEERAERGDTDDQRPGGVTCSQCGRSTDPANPFCLHPECGKKRDTGETVEQIAAATALGIASPSEKPTTRQNRTDERLGHAKLTKEDAASRGRNLESERSRVGDPQSQEHHVRRAEAVRKKRENLTSEEKLRRFAVAAEDIHRKQQAVMERYAPESKMPVSEPGPLGESHGLDKEKRDQLTSDGDALSRNMQYRMVAPSKGTYKRQWTAQQIREKLNKRLIRERRDQDVNVLDAKARAALPDTRRKPHRPDQAAPTEADQEAMESDNEPDQEGSAGSSVGIQKLKQATGPPISQMVGGWRYTGKMKYPSWSAPAVRGQGRIFHSVKTGSYALQLLKRRR